MLLDKDANIDVPILTARLLYMLPAEWVFKKGHNVAR